MEQRIQILEEEVKLLKNQIRAVLLDIKENLASGDWQSHPANNQAADPGENSGQQPKEGNSVTPIINIRPVIETTAMPASRIDPAGYDRNVTRPTFSPEADTPTPDNGHDDKTIQKQPDRNASGKGSASGLEPLTLMLLLQWLERAQGSLGRQQTQTLIELYCTTRDLPEQAKQTLQLISALYGQDKDNAPDMATIPYLLELDQLLNNNNHSEMGTFKNMILKSLAFNQTATTQNKQGANVKR